MGEYKDNSRHGYDATMAEVMQPVTHKSRSPISLITSPACADAFRSRAGWPCRRCEAKRPTMERSWQWKISGVCRLQTWLA